MSTHRKYRFFIYGAAVCGLLVVVVGVSLFICPLSIVDLKIDRVRRGVIPLVTSALETYRADFGHFPPEETGLSTLTTTIVPGQGRPYLRTIPPDPWGSRYIYRLRGADRFLLYSPGRNGVDEQGGGDDIVNWPKEYTCEEYEVGCFRPCKFIQVSAILGLLLGLVVLGSCTLFILARWCWQRATA